ncbi:MAG: efflux RND transporter periplasmic adaptor subunit [Gemmataceae bacterium]|nr:efflux RND transporter periplasmic adaptor subunit [Gemmataceae bacterium]
MLPRGRYSFKIGLSALVIGAGSILLVVAFLLLPKWSSAPAIAAPISPEPSLQAIRVGPETIRLACDAADALGVRTVEVHAASQPRLLTLSGSLGLDTNRLARVHARFAGEVMEIGANLEPNSAGVTVVRPLDFGDRVASGQLLAVVWSKDLGEKKSELAAAIAQLRIHQDNLRQMEKFSGSLPERSIREAQLAVSTDAIAVDRARRTLRSWQLTDAEIKIIEEEADRIRLRKFGGDAEPERDWARVEVRAPFAGTILERNIAPRDIVDTSVDLFKIADLGELRVWANAYEEDLPTLQSLPTPIRWAIQLKSDPKLTSLPGFVERIGGVVDPTDHTARVMGRVANGAGNMRAGQFITATVAVPPAPDEVEIPIGALVENGRESIIFIQADPAKPEFTRRPVSVARRQQDRAFIHAKPSPLRENAVLRPGERVVCVGALELHAALEDLPSTP